LVWAADPLAMTKLAEVMELVESFEVQFAQELEGDHITANRHVASYQRTFILFMKACCAHRLGWTHRALHYNHAFIRHLATFNPGLRSIL
jgi:hypothetical protein